MAVKKAAIHVADESLRQDSQIVATAAGFGPDWAVASPAGNESLVLRLVSDDVPIRGRLIDLEGRPVAGARVGVSFLKTDASGRLDHFLELVRRDPFR